MQRLNILTWHIHGSYLNALAQIEHNWYLPVRPDRADGYGGRGERSNLPSYVHEIPIECVRELDLDLILFQSPQNYLADQFEILRDRPEGGGNVGTHDSPSPVDPLRPCANPALEVDVLHVPQRLEHVVEHVKVGVRLALCVVGPSALPPRR